MRKMVKWHAMALVLLVALCVLTGNAMAATSTVSGAVVFDKTSVTAGTFVNIAILGLNSNGMVDTTSYPTGTYLLAKVSSLTGNVQNGTSSASSDASNPDAGGAFQTATNPTGYIQLSSGVAKCNVAYPSDAGNDRVTIVLQEKTSSGYRTIGSYTQDVNVSPDTSASVKKLAITTITKSPVQNDTSALKGQIIAGNTSTDYYIEVWALTASGTTETKASGSVTVTLRPSSQADSWFNVASGSSVTLTGTFSKGYAKISIDGSQLKTAGIYYVEALFNGASNVEQNTNKKYLLQVLPVDAYQLAVDVFPKIAGADATVSDKLGSSDWTGSALTARVWTLDVYGNKTTAKTAVTCRLTDTKGVLAWSGNPYTEGSVSTTSPFVDFSINALKSGTTTGTAVLQGSASGYLSNNTANVVVGSNKIWLNTTYGLGAKSTSGSNVNTGTAFYTQLGTANTTTAGQGDSVTIQFYKNGFLVGTAEGSVVTNSSDNDPSKAQIMYTLGKISTSDATSYAFLLSGYAPYSVTKSITLDTGKPANVYLKDAHGQVISQLYYDTTGNQTTVHSRMVQFADAYGNNATNANSSAVYPYGYSVTTSNGTVTGSSLTANYGETFVDKYASIAYNPTYYSGTDTLTVGSNVNSILKTTVQVVVPGAAVLKTINTSISTDTIPAGGSVPLAVDVLDQNGKPMTQNLFISWTGTASPAIYDGATALYQNASITVTSRKTLTLNVGTTTGDFTITLKDSGGTVTQQKKITVSNNTPVSDPVGADAGSVTVDKTADALLNLLVNTTNSHNDTVVYAWFMFTATSNGTQLPVYLLGNNGLVQLTDGLNIYQYTYSYPSVSPASITVLHMSDLGLKAGDQFVYAYAYQNQRGDIVIDNVVVINVK